MSKPFPRFIFEAWCWWGGWAYALGNAEWSRQHGWDGWRGDVLARLSGGIMDVLRPFWWWVRE